MIFSGKPVPTFPDHALIWGYSRPFATRFRKGKFSVTVYCGSCHCGAVRFRIKADIDELTTCDCSLCRRKNAVMAKVPEAALTITAGEEVLSTYEWNTHRAKHYFCSRCGIYTFHRKRAAPDHFGVNVFCLEGFDPASIAVRATEGIGMTVVDPQARPEWRGPRSTD
jgi:hypothetical protein